MPRLRSVWRTAFLVFWSVYLSLSIVPPLTAQTPLEITQIDLFGRKGWKSTQVSVRGFMLGMERKEVFKAAQNEALQLDDELGRACLEEKTCNVLSQGKYLGVSLVFNAEDVVEKIIIEAYKRNASKEERSAWLVSGCLGNTRLLAENYSDNSRIHFLGHPDRYEAKMPDGPSLWGKVVRSNRPTPVRRKYEYGRLGLVLRIEDWSFMSGPGGNDDLESLTFEFFRPQTVAK